MLSAALLAGIAVAGERAGEAPAAAPLDPLHGFTSEEDLRDLARTAYLDLSAGDWDALQRSLVPGSERWCGIAGLAVYGGLAVREAAFAFEEAIAADSPVYAQRVRLPALEWRVIEVDLSGDEAVVTRRARALGRAVAPPVRREDRWVVAGQAWWLDPASVAPGCGSPPPAEEADLAYEAVTPSTFERPLPVGAPVQAVSEDGRRVRVTLASAQRGSLPAPAPPPPEGFEHVYVEVRVQSEDGSQLGLPLTFRSAAFDGWFLHAAGRLTSTVCPGTEDTGVTCQLGSGLVLVAQDDPAPRLAWTPTPAHERAVGIAWWRLPTIERGGGPVVRTLTDAEAAQAADAASIRQDAWRTDFTRVTIDLREVRSAGVRDAGLAVTAPRYETVGQADAWLSGVEPVQVVEAGGRARAYPLRLMLRHEAVNDELGGRPLLVTYSPLTNTARAFERRVGVSAPTFRASAALRFNNRVLYDEATESWWQQATGEAVAGELAGVRLRQVPSPVMSWADFARAHPDGGVLSRESGFDLDYDFSPYFEVDFSPPDPAADFDLRLPAHARVIGLRSGDRTLAVPFSELDLQPVVQLELGAAPLVVFWRRGTASALSHTDPAFGRDVGAALAFNARIDGEALSFTEEEGRFVDDQTGSVWDVTGFALSGPLAGRRLAPAVHGTSFWYAWAAFNPDTEVFRPA